MLEAQVKKKDDKRSRSIMSVFPSHSFNNKICENQVNRVKISGTVKVHHLFYCFTTTKQQANKIGFSFIQGRKVKLFFLPRHNIGSLTGNWMQEGILLIIPHILKMSYFTEDTI